MAKIYRVLNPRGIPEGVMILSFAPKYDDPDKPDPEPIHWYEGDDFEKPDDMRAAAVTDFVASGFLEAI